MFAVLGDLLALCSGNELPSTLPYSQHAKAQEETCFADQIDYWKNQDLVFSLPLDLVTDNTFLPSHSSKSFTLSLSNSSFVPNSGWLLSSYYTLLHLFTQSSKVISLVRFDGKSEEFRNTVGPFGNFLPVECEISDDETVDSVMQKLQSELARAQKFYLPIPLSKFANAEDVSALPSFAYYDHPTAGVTNEITWSIESQNFAIPQGQFGATWTKRPSGNNTELTCNFSYDTRVFKADTISILLETYKNIIERCLSSSKPISDIPLLSSKYEQKIMNKWSGSKNTASPHSQLHEIFEKFAEEYPNTIAAIDDDGNAKNAKLTFGELNKASNQLAHYLVSNMGIKSGDVVAVSIPPTIQLVIAILGIVKSGASYMPLPADTPEKRMQHLFSSANVKAVVTTESDPKIFSGIPEEKVFMDWDALASMETSNLETTINPVLCVLYTSGTTGVPKCHYQTHKGFYRLIVDSRCRKVEKGGRVVLTSSFVFDAFSGGFWCGLCSGGTLVMCLTHTVVAYDTKLKERITKYSPIDELFMTTSLFHTIVKKDIAYFQKVNYLIAGGEEINKELVCLLSKSLLRPKHLVNVYGPSECAVYTTFCDCFKEKDLRGRTCVPAGIPLVDTILYIVNKKGMLVPPRFPGKVMIGGGAVGLGYCDAELSKDKFFNFRLVKQDGTQVEEEGRFYDAGDMARWNFEGSVEFIRRLDDQIKIRGHRIELGGITSVLSSVKDVSHGVVLPLSYTDSNEKGGALSLVAFYTRNAGSPPITADYFREFLSSRLASYMVPTHFIEVEKIPLRVQGKVDAQALTAIFHNYMATRSVQSEDMSELETSLVSVWTQILGHSNFSRDDDFFSIGGHSLLVNRMQSVIASELKMELSIRTLYDYPTIREMSQRLVPLVVEKNEKDSESDEGSEEEQADLIPLTVNQERFWLSAKAKDDSSSADTVLLNFWLNGHLNDQTLEDSLNHIVFRHSSLRTIFVEDKRGKAKQMIIENPPPVFFQIEDFSGYESEESLLAAIEERGLELSLMPIDLSALPSLFAFIFRVSETRSMLTLVMSHIYTDDVSIDNFMKELSEIYKNGGTTTRPLPAQYKDYSAKKALESQKEHLKYWENLLRDAPPFTSLLTDFPRPALSTSVSDTVWGFLGAEASHGLRELARELKSTVFEITFVCYAITMCRFLEQEEAVIGYTSNQHPMDDTIGIFLSILPFYFKFSDSDFAETLKRCHRELGKNYDHTHFSFSKLLRKVGHDIGSGHFPIFQVSYSYQALNRNVSYELSEDLEAKRHLISPHHTTWDITLFVEEDEDGMITPRMEYQIDLFEKSTMQSFVDSYLFLLKSVIKTPSLNPKTMCMVSEEQAHQLIEEWNETSGEYAKTRTMYSFVEQYARENPDTIAVIEDDEAGAIPDARAITYRELNELANKVARYLIQEKNFQRGCKIGLVFDKSIYYYATMLGAIKAGGVIVCLDPKTPETRLLFVKESCDLSVIAVLNSSVVPSSIRDTGIAIFAAKDEWEKVQTMDSENLNLDISSNDPFLIQLTSGSTGVPKGSFHHHRGWCNAVAPGRMSRTSVGQYLSATATISYDMAQQETWEAFLNGGTLVVFNLATLLQPAWFLERIDKFYFHVFWIAPALMTTFVNIKPDCFSKIHTLHFGGESPDFGTINIILKNNPPKHAVVAYGPSETGPYAISWDFVTGTWEEKKMRVPLGRPMLNTKAFLLDKYLQPVPPGAIGEIFITGETLSYGYYKNPVKTKQVFWPNPFSWGSLFYKSGDYGRYTAEGVLEFLGRKDGKIKLHGQMVNLDEITACLLKMEDISNAVTVVQKSTSPVSGSRSSLFGGKKVPAQQMIVTYFVSKKKIEAHVLRDYVSSKLARYMVPSFFMQLEELPITSSHKINRNLLPPVTSIRPQTEVVAPQDEDEKKIFHIWRKLGLPVTSVWQSFFEIGGDSILLVKLLSHIQTEFGVTMSFTILFQNPTISKLSTYLKTASGTTSPRQLTRVLSQENLFTNPKHDFDMIPLQKWICNMYRERGYWLSVHPSFVVKGELDKNNFMVSISSLIHKYPLLNARVTSLENHKFSIGQELTAEEVLIWHELETPKSEDVYQQLIFSAIENAFHEPTGSMFYIHVWHHKGESLVLFLVNHLVVDGPASAMLVESFAKLWGQEYTRARDYSFVKIASTWQRRPHEEKSRQHWTEMLSTNTKFALPPVSEDLKGVQRWSCDCESIDISKYLARFQSLMKKIETTSFPILASLWASAFKNYSQNGKLTFFSALQEAGKTFGPLFSLIALQCDVSGNSSIAEQSKVILKKLIEAQDHARGYAMEQVLADNPNLELPSICLISNIQHGIQRLGNSEVKFSDFLKRPLAPFDIGIFVSFPRILIEYRNNVPKSMIQEVTSNFLCLLEGILEEFPQDEDHPSHHLTRQGIQI
eukprot:TRINITY_DN5838_c0_g1_i1.p1 TRINITY_DN5838_c0_g1~~TRINITY_DN5838_c0_g1_i1.p1  ORF type:complete len:2558 (+),score=630.92 TRINITY_DN5838_c0_g1_i1:441-7676(+)